MYLIDEIFWWNIFVLIFIEKFSELQTTINEIAPLRTGIWRLSVTGVVSDLKYGRRPVVQN
jgi:hypothetical protein